jgi:hypothetical protein
VKLRYTLPALADLGSILDYIAAEAEIITHAVRHAARDPSGMPGSA